MTLPPWFWMLLATSLLSGVMALGCAVLAESRHKRGWPIVAEVRAANILALTCLVTMFAWAFSLALGVHK